jgi:hypothetical protein
MTCLCAILEKRFLCLRIIRGQVASRENGSTNGQSEKNKLFAHLKFPPVKIDRLFLKRSGSNCHYAPSVPVDAVVPAGFVEVVYMLYSLFPIANPTSAAPTRIMNSFGFID